MLSVCFDNELTFLINLDYLDNGSFWIMFFFLKNQERRRQVRAEQQSFEIFESIYNVLNNCWKVIQ